MPIQHRSIQVEAQFLPDFSNSLDSEYTLENLRRLLEHTCVEEYGYVLAIHRVVQILANKFSVYNGLLWIRCEVEATTLKPEKDDTFTAVVVDAKSVGLFGLVEGLMKCFIKPVKTQQQRSTVVFTVLETRYKNGVYETVGLEVA